MPTELPQDKAHGPSLSDAQLSLQGITNADLSQWRQALSQGHARLALAQATASLVRQSPELMKKANQALQDELQASAHQKIRALLLLEPLPEPHKRLNPREFASPLEWRMALIEQQRQNVEEGYQETMAFLKELDLSPHGAALGATAVEGEPEHILVALAWPIIKGALLDQNIPLK